LKNVKMTPKGRRGGLASLGKISSLRLRGAVSDAEGSEALPDLRLGADEESEDEEAGEGVEDVRGDPEVQWAPAPEAEDLEEPVKAHAPPEHQHPDKPATTESSLQIFILSFPFLSSFSRPPLNTLGTLQHECN
jgi:hypothetical protein